MVDNIKTKTLVTEETFTQLMKTIEHAQKLAEARLRKSPPRSMCASFCQREIERLTTAALALEDVKEEIIGTPYEVIYEKPKGWDEVETNW